MLELGVPATPGRVRAPQRVNALASAVRRSTRTLKYHRYYAVVWIGRLVPLAVYIGTFSYYLIEISAGSALECGRGRRAAQQLCLH